MGNGSRSGGDRWYGTLIFDLGRVIHKFIDWPCNIRGGIRGNREMEWGPSHGLVLVLIFLENEVHVFC